MCVCVCMCVSEGSSIPVQEVLLDSDGTVQRTMDSAPWYAERDLQECVCERGGITHGLEGSLIPLVKLAVRVGPR